MGIKQSMGRVGSALDSGDRVAALHVGVRAALARAFRTKAQARARVAAWIDEYNRDRKHSSVGMRSPINHEIARHIEARPAVA
jgi:transposase InsO family protein